MDTILSRGNNTATELPFIVAILVDCLQQASIQASDLCISNGPTASNAPKERIPRLAAPPSWLLPSNMFKALAEKTPKVWMIRSTYFRVAWTTT